MNEESRLKKYNNYDKCKINYLKNKDNKKLEKLKVAKKNIEEIETIDNGVIELDDYKPYPNYNNSNFIQEISDKKEFYYNKNKFDKDNNPCDTQKFILSNHQIFLKNFMNDKTPYKGLLLFHGVGTGKTCSAVSIAENFRDIYGRQGKKGNEDKRIIVLVPNSNVESGWRRNIYDINKGDDQCTGNTFTNEFNEVKEKTDSKENKNKKVNKIINKYYDFYGYREFANKIDKLINERNTLKNPTNLSKDEWKALITERTLKRKAIIKELFSNRLIIVDEVHNLRSNDNSSDQSKKESLKRLTEIVENSDNLKLVLLSATPMFDNKDEIIWFINILLKNDKREEINPKDIFKKDGSLNKDLLRKKCRGYISYLRGENPLSFPIRLHPCDNGDEKCYDPNKTPHKDYPYPKEDIFGKKITDDNKIKFTKLFFGKYQEQQLEYNKELLNDLESVDLDVQTDLRRKSNICFPNKLTFEETFEKKGLKYKYLRDSIDFLEEKNLQNYSIKMYNILNSIKNSQGIIFIFSEFLDYGCISMALVLERFGIKKYGNKNIYDGKKGKTKYINKGGKLTNDKTDHPASYILLTGTSANKQREIEALRSDKNKDGEVVKVIIGSPTVAEGLDFKRIREVHIMDPWYNLNKIEQIIGRGIRFCSHNDLEPIFRNVTVYLHAGYMKNKESIDIHIYKNAEIKAKEMGDVEKILKESAVDCYLNKQINHIKDSDVDKIEYVSSQNNKKEILPSDKPNTKICSFNASCDIKCQNESSISNNNSSTTNYDLLIDIIKKIERIIKRLFYERNIPFISFEDIKLELEKNYQQYNDDDNMILKKTLVYMIKNKTEVINNENTKGYLVSRSNDDQIYLLFQPKQEKDENISLYRRRTQKKIKRYNTNKLNKFTKSYSQRDIQHIKLDIEQYIKKKYEELKSEFTKEKKKNGTLSTKEFDKIYPSGEGKGINNINFEFIYFIIDTIDRVYKESLYEQLILNYDNYIKDKKSLSYAIYNHLRQNFIYDKYIMLDNNNPSKPIGYFYNNLKHNEFRQKLTDIFKGYIFKEINSNKEFTEVSSYNKKNLFQSFQKNKGTIKITDKELYGFTIYKDNQYFLKAYNGTKNHSLRRLPGNVILKPVDPKVIPDYLDVLYEKENEGVLNLIKGKKTETNGVNPLSKRAYEIHITTKLINLNKYLRYDLYLLSINDEDAQENK